MTVSPDELAVRRLYQQTFAAWDCRDATALAAGFLDDGIMIGFDGGTFTSRAEIAQALAGIFAEHQTPPIVTKIRLVRLPTLESAILHAVAAVALPDRSDINPSLNMVQLMSAVRPAGTWRIATLQSTPAAFHGQPELSEALTQELREVVRGSGG
jgi:uncharacterized protein (TIGR02246 family)